MPSTRSPLDPKKSNRALGFLALIIRPPINQAFIEKYCTPKQAQGEAPQQLGDDQQRATGALSPPLESTSTHLQRLERYLRLVANQQATKSNANGKQSTRSMTDKS